MTERVVRITEPGVVQRDWSLWKRWVGANAAAETIGLGGSALALVGLIALVDEESPGGIVVMALAAILFGTLLEGVVVGLFQWRVLREPLPALSRHRWLIATAVGACAAWTLGMLPSTLLSLALEPASVAPPLAEPPAALVYLLAAGLGLVLGPVLGVPQWLALRRYVRHAGWWVPANMLAWMLGMVIIFLGATNIQQDSSSISVVFIIAASVLTAGAVVGAVHGLALVELVKPANLIEEMQP
jgi:hypothetical protein